MKEAKKVNLDRVYARAIVEGWDDAINLAKENLPFYDEQIEEDLLAIKDLSDRLSNPITMNHEDHPIQVGRYDRCSCYEYFSKPELGIFAPDPDCEVCGGTGEMFISSSREKSYFMGINLREFWLENDDEIDMRTILSAKDTSLVEELDNEYLEVKIRWNQMIVQMYRKNRKAGMDPKTALEEAWVSVFGGEVEDEEDGRRYKV